jgi:DNA recombination-dependent growth factor C
VVNVYSVVTDFALKVTLVNYVHTKNLTEDVQISREINIESVLDRQMVTQQLQGDDIQQSLQTVDCLGNTDCLAVLQKV